MHTRISPSRMPRGQCTVSKLTQSTTSIYNISVPGRRGGPKEFMASKVVYDSIKAGSWKVNDVVTLSGWPRERQWITIQLQRLPGIREAENGKG